MVTYVLPDEATFASDEVTDTDHIPQIGSGIYFLNFQSKCNTVEWWTSWGVR